MHNRLFLPLLSVFGSLTRAAQPSAPEATAGQLRELVWGDINFLATTVRSPFEMGAPLMMAGVGGLEMANENRTLTDGMPDISRNHNTREIGATMFPS